MNDSLIPFNAAELTFIGLYLSSLVFIGWLGYRSRRENTMQDFYLAGSGIGFVVLVLTLYATQYSGNTLFGFSGKTYRIGFAWAMCIHFMTAIVVFYLLLAPKLHKIARQHQFITPSDFLEHRFRSPALSIFSSLLMVVAIANYLLGQLMAMGKALQGLTSFDPVVAYIVGVVVLALIIVVYETLGGFRAVAWTDVIQGLVLIVCFAVLLVLIFREFGSMGDATKRIVADPSHASKVAAPDVTRCLEWASYILLVGIGGALYPQAIQRIYAARSAATLRRSLAVMAFMPLTTTLIAVIVGIIGLAYIPGLITSSADNSDTVLTVICRRVQENSLLGRWLVVVLFAGILAAIMSTADSVLLSISSMLTKDVYARVIRPRASNSELTKFGKACSWVLIVVLVVLAILLRETHLVKLLDRKFDLLVQLGPAFFIGLHWEKMRAGPTFAGLVIGVVIAVALAACGYGKIFGVHAGLFALPVNLAIAIIGSWLAPAERMK